MQPNEIAAPRSYKIILLFTGLRIAVSTIGLMLLTLKAAQTQPLPEILLPLIAGWAPLLLLAVFFWLLLKKKSAALWVLLLYMLIHFATGTWNLLYVPAPPEVAIGTRISYLLLTAIHLWVVIEVIHFRKSGQLK